MQTAINPGLAQVIGAMDRISPVTPEGTPTVAAQVMQAAGMAPPALPQIAQQAGLGGQIQAMQMQEAQKQLMEAAMRQQQMSQMQPQMRPQMPPQQGGLEALNPRIGNFAQGGIVGYNRGGMTPQMQEMLRRRREEREREGSREEFFDVSPSGEIQSYRQDPEAARAVLAATTPMMEIPDIQIAAQPSAPRAPAGSASPAASGAQREAAPQGIAGLFEKERQAYSDIKGPATAQDILAREQIDRPVYEQFLRSRGIDPNMLTKRGEEDKALIEQQRALLRERMAREEGEDTFSSRLGAALRGFRQMKGQGTGDAFLRAHDSLSRQVQAGQIRMDQFRDMEIRLNELEITRRRALDDARKATAEGDWNRASQALSAERTAANEILKLQAPTYGKQAQVMVQERQVQESGAARRADQQRIQELYQLRLNTLTGGKPPTDEQKMEAMEYALQTVKGAGSAARTAMAGQRLSLDQLRALQKTYAEQAENMLLPQVQRDQAAQMLKQVNDQIAASAGISAPATKGAPAPGTVMDGYRFKGGNPADKANWEKV